MEFKGKNVIVTGGLRGIGKSILLGFASEGANVIAFDLIDENLNETKIEVEKFKVSFDYFKVDVSNLSQVEKTVEEVIKKYENIDFLINNAGITKDNLLISMSEEEWDKVISVNLKGTFNCSKSVVKYMIKKRSGVIINISSVIGIMGNKGQANYAASKAGIIGLTKSLAKEVGSRNVRVNAIAPGFIETDMTKKLPEDVVKEYAKLIPLGRMGKPEDVANLCLFLSSDKASYITGQVIHCDGGMLM
uniref:3-oxoacyl-[acyl-carrier-protein] reductase n=1 Tax=candidate division WOR-3 bacterium TaxID=2052148 RepID=A0A7C3J5V0_UNCW3